MPIFDYICENCKTEAKDKLVQSYKTKVKCPKCDTFMIKKISKPNLGNMNKYGSSY